MPSEYYPLHSNSMLDVRSELQAENVFVEACDPAARFTGDTVMF